MHMRVCQWVTPSSGRQSNEAKSFAACWKQCAKISNNNPSLDIKVTLPVLFWCSSGMVHGLKATLVLSVAFLNQQVSISVNQIYIYFFLD